MNEDWLNKIHKQMADYEIAEPENLWESIENKHIKPSSAGIDISSSWRHGSKEELRLPP